MRSCAAATDEAPVSGVSTSRSSDSQRLWDLDWASELPWTLDGVTVSTGSFTDDAAPFMQAHYAALMPTDERFFAEPMSPAKRRYFEVADVFVFRDGERPIGICIGHPSDWSTYYVRTIAILPEYRHRHVATGFEEHLSAALHRAGVARMEADTSPANSAMMRLFVGQRFLVTATANSERWGTMLRFTKFLDPAAGQVFRRQYVYVPPLPRPNSTGNPEPGRREP